MNKPYGYIYKIVCKTSGKSYIGQTIRSLSSRFSSHISDAKKESCDTKIGRAIRKYGKENFSIHLICRADNREEINAREISCIRLFNSIEDGYNISTGGYGGIHSEETRKKMSLAGKGKKKPKGFGEKISRALKGKKHSESHRLNNIKAQKACQAHYEFRHTEEFKKKMGDRNRGKFVSAETRAKIVRANTGRKASDETKRKMSEKRKGRKPPNQKTIKCTTTGETYISIKSASEILGLSDSSLQKHLKGDLKTVKGLVFKYV